MAFELTPPGDPEPAASYQSIPWSAGVTADAKRVYFCTSDGGVDILTVRRRGDVDGNEQIGLSDLALILAAFGSCGADSLYNRYADLDEDGCVSISDLTHFLSLFGS